MDSLKYPLGSRRPLERTRQLSGDLCEESSRIPDDTPLCAAHRRNSVKKAHGIEAQFIYETDEILKDFCFDLTNRLHDYDMEVRMGQDLTHRVLYLCTTPEEAKEIARLLGESVEIRGHKLH